MGQHYQPNNPFNYTTGGVRAWFNRDIDLTTTPVRREGFRDLGNVLEAPQEQAVENLEHYTARSGTRKKDREVTTQIGENIILTMDEPNVYNLRYFFRGGDVSDVAASSGNVVTDEVAMLIDTDTIILGYGFTAASVVVKDITGVTTYVADTDYEVVDVIGGYKGVRRIDGGAIASGDLVRISYTHTIRAHKRFAPTKETEIKGQFLLFGVSDTGNEFIRSFQQVQLFPEGSFDYNSEDWSTFQLRVEILDDTENNPNFPFGIFEHYGVGEDL